jgi:hypothetical protein
MTNLEPCISEKKSKDPNKQFNQFPILLMITLMLTGPKKELPVKSLTKGNADLVGLSLPPKVYNP